MTADGAHTGGDRDQLLLAIAGLRIGLTSAVPFAAIGLDPAYREFAAAGPADTWIDLRFGPVPEPPRGAHEPVFDSGALWSYRRSAAEHLFVLRSPNAGPTPYRVARFTSDLSSGEILSTPAGLGGVPGPRLPDPLEYPLGEALTICLLARGRGLMTHACGVDDHGRGYLFCGNSGDGKTTLARLWAERGRVLNDDRIVVRPVDGRLWMEPTPWHGDLSRISPAPAPLDRIFFIRHAAQSAAHRLGAAAAAQLLLVRCFPPFWSTTGMEQALAAIEAIVSTVPVYELDVVPDATIVELVRAVD